MVALTTTGANHVTPMHVWFLVPSMAAPPDGAGGVDGLVAYVMTGLGGPTPALVLECT